MITLDDGHPGSYDHSAEQSPLVPDEGVEVTLTCECGDWVGSDPAGADGEPGDDLTQAWIRHVYAATGRWQADYESGVAR